LSLPQLWPLPTFDQHAVSLAHDRSEVAKFCFIEEEKKVAHAPISAAWASFFIQFT
jgi:hypothetical protein